MKGPIAAVAAVGAILGGLAGYWNAIQAVKGTAEAPRTVAAEAAAPGMPAPKSIAVLAFANLGDDKLDEQFADGVSEELLNLLSRVPGLRVTARRSSFHFKGQAVPVAEMNFGLFDPAWDPVRADPRFRAWLLRFQLTEAHERAQTWRSANPAPALR